MSTRLLFIPMSETILLLFLIWVISESVHRLKNALVDLFKAMELPTYDYGVDMYHKFGQERVLSDPGVPVHIFYGTGLDTTCAMDYRNKRFPNYSPKEC